MAVRNFWIELDVDGRKTRIATGPRSKSGGFSMKIKIRNQGGSDTALVINGWAAPDNELAINASTGDNLICQSLSIRRVR